MLMLSHQADIFGEKMKNVKLSNLRSLKMTYKYRLGKKSNMFLESLHTGEQYTSEWLILWLAVKVSGQDFARLIALQLS
jgi:hypothetical protein